MTDLYDILEQKYELNKYSDKEIQEAIDILETPVGEQMFTQRCSVRKLREEYLGTDAFRLTYKGNEASDYEQRRKEVLKKLESMSDISEKMDYLIEEAKDIREGIYFLNYNEALAKSLKPPFMIEICKNMMLSGFTLTEICKAVPGAQMGDIYHLGERYLGITLELSEEEQRQVEEYNSQDDESNTVNVVKQLTERRGLPHYDSEKECWTLKDDDGTYDATDAARLYAGCDLKYPFYRDNSMQPEYADSFDEILGKLLKYPRDISIEGMEKLYGAQELNLFRKTKEKLLQQMEENMKK